MPARKRIIIIFFVIEGKGYGKESLWVNVKAVAVIKKAIRAKNVNANVANIFSSYRFWQSLLSFS